ncbi:Crp/Fnr family transcriptional regulator [Bauldia sp.]|uniref:Crp/Fnr family transcriptional regulator n=1 Tax=Bauldia sp. TaxID=2575872 RepID=UPI003BA9F933
MAKAIFDVDVLAGADLGILALLGGRVLYAAGDEGDRAYVVRRGTVALHCGDMAIEVLGPGEMFGVASLLDGKPRACTATANRGTELIPLSAPLVKALVSDDPDFAGAVTNAMVRRLRAALTAMGTSISTSPSAALDNSAETTRASASR